MGRDVEDQAERLLVPADEGPAEQQMSGARNGQELGDALNRAEQGRNEDGHTRARGSRLRAAGLRALQDARVFLPGRAVVAGAGRGRLLSMTAIADAMKTVE